MGAARKVGDIPGVLPILDLERRATHHAPNKNRKNDLIAANDF
jgi:hypothetical protein